MSFFYITRARALLEGELAAEARITFFLYIIIAIITNVLPLLTQLARLLDKKLQARKINREWLDGQPAVPRLDTGEETLRLLFFLNLCLLRVMIHVMKIPFLQSESLSSQGSFVLTSTPVVHKRRRKRTPLDPCCLLPEKLLLRRRWKKTRKCSKCDFCRR